MDYFRKYIDQISVRIFAGIIVISSVAVAGWWLLIDYFDQSLFITIAVLAAAILITSLIATIILARTMSRPLFMLARVLAYKSQPNYSDSQPNIKQLHTGRELITALAQQVYDLADGLPAKSVSLLATDSEFVFDNIAIPMIAVDKTGQVKAANRAANTYFGHSSMVSKPLVDVANLSFPSENTLETWLGYCRQNKVTAAKSWYRVRHNLPDNKGTRQFDLSASFMKDAPSGIELVIGLFDQTDRYSQDDQSIDFVALAVHELRTPLTIMRGYIEVFEEELGPTLNPEMQSFMHKMNASAQSLTSFVSNILNVARVEENQLTLALREEQWEPILRSAVNDLDLRARVHGKQLSLTVAPNLPTVAVDRVSIHEVINNLIENAVKYSGDSREIKISSSLNSEGMVETSVTDHGIGIPAGVLPHLFEKFYRSHRTRGTASGSGLGLFLSKAIIDAHGGTIKVETKEGQGSTFSFALQPFANLGQEAKAAGQDGIIRGAHGWIKNHNLYRR